jgi:conflict system STAND superfamily ATPase
VVSVGVPPSMTGPELRRAILEPVRRAGVSLEDGMVEVVLRDARVTQDTGALSLLSHALLSWSCWKGGAR